VSVYADWMLGVARGRFWPSAQHAPIALRLCQAFRQHHSNRGADAPAAKAPNRARRASAMTACTARQPDIRLQGQRCVSGLGFGRAACIAARSLARRHTASTCTPIPARSPQSSGRIRPQFSQPAQSIVGPFLRSVLHAVPSRNSSLARLYADMAVQSLTDRRARRMYQSFRIEPSSE
jgi:hypothetical protein